MPLEWKKGGNPYRQNYFNIIKSGPNATPQQIVDNAKKAIGELKAGIDRVLDDVEVDEYLIMEAKTKLLEVSNRFEEMILAHPPPLKNSKREKHLFNELSRLSEFPVEQPELMLIHPLAVLWFLPPPAPEDLDLPEWDEFGLGNPGDETDQHYDIVFDI